MRSLPLCMPASGHITFKILLRGVASYINISSTGVSDSWAYILGKWSIMELDTVTFDLTAIWYDEDQGGDSIETFLARVSA